MSGPDDINAVAVAMRVMANPRVARVSAHEEQAMASCLLGLCVLLDQAEQRPTTNARLAAAVASLIQTRAAWNDLAEVVVHGPDRAGARAALPAADRAYTAAFNHLQTIFETEFPQ